MHLDYGALQGPSFAIFMIFIQVNLSEAYIALLDVACSERLHYQRMIYRMTDMITKILIIYMFSFNIKV